MCVCDRNPAEMAYHIKVFYESNTPNSNLEKY